MTRGVIQNVVRFFEQTSRPLTAFSANSWTSFGTDILDEHAVFEPIETGELLSRSRRLLRRLSNWIKSPAQFTSKNYISAPRKPCQQPCIQPPDHFQPSLTDRCAMFSPNSVEAGLPSLAGIPCAEPRPATPRHSPVRNNPGLTPTILVWRVPQIRGCSQLVFR